MSQDSKTPAPIINAEIEFETSQLIKSNKSAKKLLIGEIEVRSKEQPRMSLGKYTSENPPKGFAIHINPDPEPDAIVTQIMRTGTDKKYELVLHVANYGDKTICAEVWRMQ